MNWLDVWKIIATALASAGGIGGLILLVVKLASNFIAESLSQKYQISLQKELECHKSQLDSKTYISKARFDREFAMYQDLCEKNITMVYDMGAAVMITRGARLDNADSVQDFIKLAAQHLDDAEITNKRYAPFISKDIFENYKELENQAYTIISLLGLWDSFNNHTTSIITYNQRPYTKQQVKQEIEDKQKILSKLSDDILDKLRNYLSHLDTMEDK